MLKRKKVKPITLRDVTIIDDGKLRKAITAASLGNAMEWFDFGVYGFVAYALGKVFFPGADPSVQMVAALVKQLVFHSVVGEVRLPGWTWARIT